MKLTLGVIILGLLVGTLYGPLTILAEPPEGGFLTDTAFWTRVLEDGVQSFANSALAIIGVVAAAFGLPILQRKSPVPETPEEPTA